MQRDLHVEVREEAILKNFVVDFHDRITKLKYSESIAQAHFWVFFIGVNVTFFPMVRNK